MQRRFSLLLGSGFYVLESFALLQAAPETNLIEITAMKQFNELKQQAKPIVLEFCAEWCGPCKQAKPTVKKLAANNPGLLFLIVDVDKKATTEIKKQYSPTAYPTFIFIDADGNEFHRITGASTLEENVNTLKTKKPAPKPVKEETPSAQPKKPSQPITPAQSKPADVATGAVIELQSEQQFNDLKAKKNPMILDIYTQWCGPCKTFRPTFESLAKEYTDVLFVAIDAEQFSSLCLKYGASSYPTFVYLDAQGNQITKQSGAPSSDMLIRNNLKKISSKTDGTKIIGEYTERMTPTKKGEAVEPMPSQQSTKSKRAKSSRPRRR